MFFASARARNLLPVPVRRLAGSARPRHLPLAIGPYWLGAQARLYSSTANALVRYVQHFRATWSIAPTCKLFHFLKNSWGVTLSERAASTLALAGLLGDRLRPVAPFIRFAHAASGPQRVEPQCRLAPPGPSPSPRRTGEVCFAGVPCVLGPSAYRRYGVSPRDEAPETRHAPFVAISSTFATPSLGR